MSDKTSQAGKGDRLRRVDINKYNQNWEDIFLKNKLKKCGVYYIINNANNKRYIGSTTVSFSKRFGQHLRLLRKNKHDNLKLQRAWNKYGEENFSFCILEICLPHECLELEQKNIDKYNSHTEGYNTCPVVGNCQGRKASEETRVKLSISHIGRNHSLETKQKMSVSQNERIERLRNSGKKVGCIGHTKESREKISKNHSRFWQGKKRSEEDKNKMRKKKRFYSGKTIPVKCRCGDFEYSFNSISHASKFHLLDRPLWVGAISNCAKGFAKSAGKINGEKVYWEFENRDVEDLERMKIAAEMSKL